MSNLNARRKKERRLDSKGRLFIDSGGRAADRNWEIARG